MKKTNNWFYKITTNKYSSSSSIPSSALRVSDRHCRQLQFLQYVSIPAWGIRDSNPAVDYLNLCHCSGGATLRYWAKCSQWGLGLLLNTVWRPVIVQCFDTAAARDLGSWSREVKLVSLGTGRKPISCRPSGLHLDWGMLFPFGALLFPVLRCQQHLIRHIRCYPCAGNPSINLPGEVSLR